MAASTITRDTWTNDTGSAAAPNADGTILNNSVLQNHIYARVDAMFAGAGAYATLTFGGLLAAEGFGTHTFSAGGTGGNFVKVRNPTAGTGNLAGVRVGNDGAADAGGLDQHSTTYTTSGIRIADSTLLYGSGAGGVVIAGSHANGLIRFYTVSSERMRITDAGNVLIGTTSAGGAPAGELVIPNNTSIRALNNAGTATSLMLLDSNNRLQINGNALSIIIANPLTSTTVGAAGGAAAIPATPTAYLVIRIGGTDFKIPYYAS